MASSSMPAQPNPLQQRAAAAAQALLPPRRTVSQREIQAMLEKNEAALKGWNTLFKQQPAKTNAAEHKDWIRRCLTFRQQIGARLEFLASLADKQIAQENTSSTFKAAETASIPMEASTKPALENSGTRDLHVSAPPTSAPAPMYMSPQTLTMGLSTSMSMEQTPASSTCVAMPNMTAPLAPTIFPEPPMPMGFSSSSSMFFPPEALNPMATSSGFTASTSIPASGITTSTQGYAVSSGVETFTQNTYIPSTRGPPSSSSGYLNEPNYMMGSGAPVSQQQQFLAMQMPVNMTSVQANGNMYSDPTSFAMPSGSTAVNGNGLDTPRHTTFMVDPFLTPLEFSSDSSFGSSGFPMTGMTSMAMQQPHVLGAMNGPTFGAPIGSTGFEYGAHTAMPLPHAFQPPPQHYHDRTQLPHETPTESLSLSSDLALFGDNHVNIFEDLPDDAFFPLQ
ncbi:hypothetical protein PsorP6_004355 [Peronosclerospora sorghi]|uniref:Uncharacterized protein n=1 Tax=Peronosclerospora sorghi TaxID=230839 RepID=A0ACC0VM67_9STRA|nr:hypothetical protein PsorP6_004355 [Peronosclerospora sorghi]